MHELIPKYYYFINKLDIEEIKDLNKKIGIIYRNYEIKPKKNEIQKFYNFCKKNRIKFLISNYFDLALKYNLDGFYIPSFNKKYYLKKKASNKNFLLIGSAHNMTELKFKEKQNVKLVFISPIFKVKKKNIFLNIIKFNNLSKASKNPVIALGGINPKNVNQLKMTRAFGFSGISHIKNIIK